MSHFLSVKTTLHPCLHRIQILIRDAIRDATVKCGTMCPVRTVGSPWMKMSHSCVEEIFFPSGKFMTIGFVVIRLFWTLAVSIANMDDAPASAIACVVSIRFLVVASTS